MQFGWCARSWAEGGAEEAERKPESAGPWRPHKGIGHDPKSKTLCVREQS